ncbi:S-adenosyl-L-methionine-dependent methyltransferase [Xylariaceae sp. FL0594]|nr:S-adenosyl-L-methionine-dependent methyltransferase [Xylariaceae sp. FL0594]
MSSFEPKQKMKVGFEDLEELMGGVSDTANRYSLGLIPPLQTGDVVHDNACGSGAVTNAIMTTEERPSGIHIFATDINTEFVKGVQKLAEKNNWPLVEASDMPAEALKFKDGMFTHSITNFAFNCIGAHEAAAREVYRTLRPDGGVAIASVWAYMAHVAALQHAHYRTRDEEEPMPTLLPLKPFGEEDLRAALRAGGFADDKIECHYTTAYLTVPAGGLESWARLAWSYLGPLPSGWLESDEERWEEAIADIVEQLQPGKAGIKAGPNGESVMEFRAIIAVARK